MQLLLCAATEFEIKPVIDLISRQNRTDIRVLISGVGLMATAYSLLKAVSQNRPDFVIQAGIAGCLNEDLPLGKIVLIENETVGDLGVQEHGRFHSLFDLNLQQRNQFPWTNGKLHNNLKGLSQSGLKIVDGVSVNEITTDPERIGLYRDHFGASVESMEGAALHYTCIMEQIPFLQFRSLSNFVGERDKSKWVMGHAIAQLNHELERIINKF
jgi:futalosine hydrolase